MSRADLTLRIKSVSPTSRPFSLLVADGKTSVVSLAELAQRSRHFYVFDSDPQAFTRVKPDEFGTGIEWENGLDCSAHILRAIASTD